MIFRNSILSLLLCLFYCNLYSQEQLSSEKAFERHKELQAKHKGTKIDTHTKEYFDYYFQQLDLLPLIEDEYNYVLLQYYHLAYSFRYYGLPKESVKNYKLFFNYYKKFKSRLTEEEKQSFFKRISVAYGYMADMYSKLSQLDSAKIQHDLNIEHTISSNTIYYASALNNYGLFYYWTKKENDIALNYFKKALQICEEKFPNDHLIGSIRDNIADIFVEQEELEKAKQLYKINFSFYRQGFHDNIIDVNRLILAGCQLVQTDIQLFNQLQAQKNFIELEQIIQDPIYKVNSLSKAKLEFLKTKELLMVSQKKTREAYIIAKNVKNLSDSITNINSSAKTLQKSAISNLTLQRMRDNNALEKKEKEGEIERQNLKLWIITILLLSFIGFLSSLFLRRRQLIINAKDKQLIAEQDLKFAALKNDQLHSEIKSKERDLSDFAINLSQNQEWAQIMVNKWNILKETKGRKRKNLMDDFEKGLQNKISFDKDTQEFYERLDKLSDTFYSHLNSQFPNLSKTEKRLCSLIRLKVDNHEIATIQNITQASLNTSRYRLRKKLNLTKEGNLDAYIQSL